MVVMCLVPLRNHVKELVAELSTLLRLAIRLVRSIEGRVKDKN
jgi:hypothetical protein